MRYSDLETGSVFRPDGRLAVYRVVSEVTHEFFYEDSPLDREVVSFEAEKLVDGWGHEVYGEKEVVKFRRVRGFSPVTEVKREEDK